MQTIRECSTGLAANDDVNKTSDGAPNLPASDSMTKLRGIVSLVTKTKTAFSSDQEVVVTSPGIPSDDITMTAKTVTVTDARNTKSTTNPLITINSTCTDATNINKNVNANDSKTGNKNNSNNAAAPTTNNTPGINATSASATGTRTQMLRNLLTRSVYTSVCSSLFEKHKPLFALLLAFRINRARVRKRTTWQFTYINCKLLLI